MRVGGVMIAGIVGLTGCADAILGRHDEAAALVQSSFDAARQPGRVGVEVLGKGVWYKAPTLDGACLQHKGMAFNSDPRKSKDAHGRPVARISPTYDAQRMFVTSTEDGYCVYVGNELAMNVIQTNLIDGVYRVDVEFSMGNPDGWWECVGQDAKRTTYEVVEDGTGALSVQNGPVGIGQGACPAPLPVGEQRKAEARPRKRPNKLPTHGEIAELVQAFDTALRERDHLEALSHVSCFNLFEESKYGTCSTAELVALAPIPQAGETWMEPPWTDGAFDSMDQLGRVFPDREDDAMVHVTVTPSRGTATRTMALHWVDDQWKLVGVVGAKAEGLTSARFVYDLDRKEKREIFERRLAGEPIDEKGFPLDPFAKPEAEDKGPTEITF